MGRARNKATEFARRKTARIIYDGDTTSAQSGQAGVENRTGAAKFGGPFESDVIPNMMGFLIWRDSKSDGLSRVAFSLISGSGTRFPQANCDVISNYPRPVAKKIGEIDAFRLR